MPVRYLSDKSLFYEFSKTSSRSNATKMHAKRCTRLLQMPELALGCLIAVVPLLSAASCKIGAVWKDPRLFPLKTRPVATDAACSTQGIQTIRLALDPFGWDDDDGASDDGASDDALDKKSWNESKWLYPT